MYELLSEKQGGSGGSILPTRSIKRWVIATFVLIVISLIEICVIVKLASQDPPKGFENGFATELPEAKDAISVEQVRFTSPLRVDENGTLHQVNDPSERRYTGNSSEVDQAWEDLVFGRYLRLRESEVNWLDSDEESDNLEVIPEDVSVITKAGMYGGVDMLYSLHCLNMLRKHLHSDHKNMQYFSDEEDSMHLGKSSIMALSSHTDDSDHCIDQLRQSIMCAGDLTPVTLRHVWMENPRRSVLLGETERMHTCRNFDAIRDWATERGVKEGRIEA